MINHNLRLSPNRPAALQMHSKISPPVDLKMIRNRDPSLVYLPFFSSSMFMADNLAEGEDEGKSHMEAFDFKSIKEIYSTNYYEGDAVIRLQITLPYDAKPGGVLYNIGGYEGINVKVPSQMGRSPIVNVMVPKFCLLGVPEVRDMGLNERGKYSRVELDLKDSSAQAGDRIVMMLEVPITMRKPVGSSRLEELQYAVKAPQFVTREVSFLYPRFPEGSSSKKVMVIVNREEPLLNANIEEILHRTDNGYHFDYDHLDSHGSGAGAAGGEPISGRNPMK